MNISKLFKFASAFYKIAGMNHDEAYSVLKLPYGTHVDDVTRQFRNLSKTQHPDRGGDMDQYKILSLAYHFLMNHPTAPPRDRQQYSTPPKPTTAPFRDWEDFRAPAPSTHLIFDSKVFGSSGEKFNTRSEAMYELPISVGELKWFYNDRIKPHGDTSNISMYADQFGIQIVALKYDGKYKSSCAYMKLDNIKNIIAQHGKEKTILLVSKNIIGLINNVKNIIGLIIPKEEYIDALFLNAVTNIVIESR